MQNPDTRENAPALYVVLNEREFWLACGGSPEELWEDDEESNSGGGTYFEEEKEIYIFLSEWHRGPTWVGVTLVNFLVACYIHELLHHVEWDAVERLVANAEFALVGWIIDGTKRQG